MKKTVVFDFDGVIHSYTSGWKGESVITDPPVPRIKEAISDIRLAGYEVVVVSTRCATKEGHGAVRGWLIDNEIEVDAVKTEKPPAVVYIDDRAICFDGNPDNLLNKIIGFEPWYKNTVKTNADRLDAMSIEEKAQFLHSIAYNRETPWSKPFYEKFCKDCPAPEYTLDDGRKLCLHECDFKDGKCPHGTDIVWWLQQPSK